MTQLNMIEHFIANSFMYVKIYTLQIKCLNILKNIIHDTI